MNKVVLIGRLTKDPEIRYGGQDGDKAVSRFTVAVDRKFKTENQSADFINCIAFGKTAEFIEKYFTKGMRIAADGRIQTGSYTNKEGNKVYTTDVVLENVEFCEKKNSAQDVPPSQPDNDGFMNIPDGIDEELPFN